jgi:hypothetical protein
MEIGGGKRRKTGQVRLFFWTETGGLKRGRSWFFFYCPRPPNPIGISSGLRLFATVPSLH